MKFLRSILAVVLFGLAAAFAQVSNVTNVATIAKLRQFSGAGVASVNVQGYYAANDGGGGTYVWNATSTATDNGGTIIAPTGVAIGRWVLKYLGEVNVRQFGAKGDGITDDTSAVQAAVNCAVTNANQTVVVPTGQYYISGTITVSQGVVIRGFGSQGSTQQYGACFVHYSTGDLFVWNSSGAANASVGGGLENILILKAAGYSGGNAIKLLAVDDSHRPGEMLFINVLVASLSGTPNGQWACCFLLDGSACNTPGSAGIRSVVMYKCRFSSASTNDQYVLINQGVHFTGNHIQIDQGIGTGTPGMTVEGNSDNFMMSDCIINGDVVIAGSSAMNVSINGRVSTLNVTNTLVVGAACIQSQSILNAAPGLRVVSNHADSFLAVLTSTASSVTGDGTEYDPLFDTVKFDLNSSYNAGTGRFTANSAGVYIFNCNGLLTGLLNTHTGSMIQLVHKSAGGSVIDSKVIARCSPWAAANSAAQFEFSGSAIFQLNKGDYVYVSINVSNGTKVVNVLGDPSTTYTSFSGQLL